jgi:hypothetical protein
MAHTGFSLLVPDEAFPDGRNKLKTSNPPLVIRGQLAAAFSRYTAPPPPNEGGGAAAEDAGEGPVGVIYYSALESLILSAARFHSDCAALPIFMAVLTLEAADVALGFLADLLVPDDTNLSGTRLKDLALTALKKILSRIFVTGISIKILPRISLPGIDLSVYLSDVCAV